MLHTACNVIVLWTIFDINRVTAKPSPSTPRPTQASQNEPQTTSSNSAAIGGAVGGSIAVIITIIVVIYCVRSRRRNGGQSDFKPNASIVCKNNAYNSVEQPRASEEKRAPYSGLSNARENEAPAYDKLGVISNTNSNSNANEEAEYCYISDSDLMAAQRQSGNPIPTVRNNKSLTSGISDSQFKSASSSINADSSVRYNNSDVPSYEKQPNDYNSGRNSSLGDQTYSNQTGSQQISSLPVNREPHEYLVLEPELTSL